MNESPRPVGPEGRYFQILDTAPDAMLVVDGTVKIVYVNRQAEKLFGYTREELLQAPLETVIPERFRGTHGAHVERYFATPGIRPMGLGLELVGRRKDGSEVPIEVSLSPVETDEGSSVCAAIRDISERKRVADNAKLNADRLASGIENIHEAFALYDAEDRLVLCNGAFRRLLGPSVSDPIGQRYVDLLAEWSNAMDFANEEARETYRAARIEARRNPKGLFEASLRDGRIFRISTHRTIEGGVVETIWDLTDDARRERELHDARIAAEAGSAAKSDFLSSMSHELRTPLNAILGFAQLLERDKKEPLSTRHRERVREIVRGGGHLLRLIDDILDLSRIEAGGLSISPEPVDPAEAMEAAKTPLEPMATRAGITFDVTQADTVPMVSADRTRLIQILMNFGSNAIKYNRTGGKVTFSILQSGPEFVRFTVSDNGIGIATHKQAKLFQPFQRAGQETGPIEGTGIGLVITKRLAELMGGRIGFTSTAGVGSEFWVELPIHASVIRDSQAPQAAASNLARLEDGKHRLVVYVEDNPANVSFMTDLLSAFSGVTLVCVPTAEIGIELARARQPAFIIMDINLPGMSGFDALRVLREIPETKDIPVIALTAAASDRDRDRGEHAGFYRYLTKPVRVEEFENAVEGLLRATSD